jgi:hypothetical protein
MSHHPSIDTVSALPVKVVSPSQFTPSGGAIMETVFLAGIPRRPAKRQPSSCELAAGAGQDLGIDMRGTGCGGAVRSTGLSQLLKLQVVTVPLPEFADTLTGSGVPLAAM